MPNENFILFLDLETTGNQPEDEILEVGLVLIDAKDFSEVSRFTQTIHVSQAAHQRVLTNDVVFKMHSANGLLNEADNWGLSVSYTDDLISEWLNYYVKGNDHIPYGGSGVAHFDRKYIDKYLPKLSKRITYWALDVGSFRRIYRLAGGDMNNWPTMRGDGDKTHRALDDALYHVEEFKYALSVVQTHAATQYVESIP